jgi:NodT family efflux transporter outer membrane factor (OMF) lipoprotein
MRHLAAKTAQFPRLRDAVACVWLGLLSPFAGGQQLATLQEAPLLPQTYRFNLPSEQKGQDLRGAWWMNYGSEELNHLVDRALANNSELRLATLQLAQTRIRADQTRAGSLPFLSAPVRTVSQNGGTTSDALQSSQVGLQATYRLDIWGEQKALEASSELQMWRAVYERQNVQRNVVGNLVMAYIAWLEVNDSIAVTRENEVLTRRILQSVEQRMALGDATKLELEIQRAAVNAQAAQIAALESQRDDYLTAIARVLGTSASQVQLSGRGLDDFTVPNVETGLPSRLLLRRPDVRMVEARLRAANADIDVARARLLPPVDLSAQAGYSALGLASLFQPQNFLMNAIASLAVTIFDGGRRDGDKASADFNREQMVETYAQMIFQALREVESSLSALRAARLRQDAQFGSMRASLAMYEATSESYQAGAAEMSSLLDARRNLQRSQDDWQKSKAEAMRAYATLAFALGGDTSIDSQDGDGNTETHNMTALSESANPVITTREALRKLNGWAVEIPQLAHRQILSSVWRDLQQRYAEPLQGKSLRAIREGAVSEKPQETESWYRLTLTGFAEQFEAEKFCGAMRQELQTCKVIRYGN